MTEKSKSEALGVDQEGSTARTTDVESESSPPCEKCGCAMENPLKLAGPYCVNLECSRRGAVILPPLDLSIRKPCPDIRTGPPTFATEDISDIRRALDATNIIGIFDEFKSMSDAVEQMGLYIKELEAREKNSASASVSAVDPSWSTPNGSGT